MRNLLRVENFRKNFRVLPNFCSGSKINVDAFLKAIKNQKCWLQTDTQNYKSTIYQTLKCRQPILHLKGKDKIKPEFVRI